MSERPSPRVAAATEPPVGTPTSFPSSESSLDRASELEHMRLAVEVSGVHVPGIVLPDSHDVLIGRMRLHYLDWGNADRPPILFLHGGGLTAHTWDMVCLSLRDAHHCVALDQRGHGDSEWSPELDYGPDAHLRDIEGLVDRLGFDRFVVVGQSMGALNGFTYATRHSDRLRALVLIDAGPELRLDGAQRIASFLHQTAEPRSLEEFIEQAMAFNPLRDRRLLKRSLLYNLRRLPSGHWMRKNDMRRFASDAGEELFVRARAGWTGEERVRCPTLVVRGEKSDVFSDEAAEHFAHALPDGRWVRIAGAGHTVQGDNPRALVAAMTRFFAEIGA